MAKRKIRIRPKRLDQISEDRLALAVWLIARDEVKDETTPPPFETDDDLAGDEEAV